MRDLISRFFPVNAYTDPIDRYRAQAVYVTSAITLLVMAFGLIALQWRFSIPDDHNNLFFQFLSITAIILPISALLAIVLTRFEQRIIAALVIIASWVIPACIMIFNSDLTSSNYWIGYSFISVAILLGALLIGPRSVLNLAILSTVILIASALRPQSALAYFIGFGLILFILLLIIQAAITYYLARGLPDVVKQVVTRSEESRLRLAEASNTITQRLLATRLDLNALLKETVALVSNISADVSDVQIFMVDEDRRNATLVASTANLGPDQEMKLGQKIGIGSLSVIGRATINGQTIVVRDTNEERAYRRSAFLQGTRAELALPLRVGNDVIGVLDIQSRNTNAFSAESVKSLETLTNQIAIVVDNARLYAEAQSQLAENTRLFEQTRTSLREIERLNRQLTGSAWSEYLRAQGQSPAFTIDLTSGQVENVSEWTNTMADASRRNQITVRQTPQSKVVAMPISVRGQSIGAMEFELALEQEVTTEQLAVLTQIIERLGLAVENTRLFEETQRIAQREALVNEISARMQVTTNVEAVIAAATQGLADAFHAPRVSIRLGSPTDNGNGSSDRAMLNS
jgi:GAF domain-containing protein